jgi:indole-3-glycerol phosphate synthase
MSNVLQKILDDKKEHVARNKYYIPDVVLKEKALAQNPCRRFIDALRHTHQSGQTAIIAEIKKASPSKGILRADFDPVQIASIYEQNGASCLSILTDQPYFKGSDEDLEIVRQNCSLPILRKDFMVDEYQIHESRAMGADCILIIMAALDDSQAKDMMDVAFSYGMDCLVEIHDEDELNRAMALNATMIGVNSRSLKTLQVDLDTARGLSRLIPHHILKIAESGIASYADIQNLQSHEYQGFLIGESFMVADDISGALKNMLGKAA